MRILLLIGLCILLIPFTAAVTLYVNESHVSCSNSNTYTQAQNPSTPWCTIPQTCFNDGDLMMVADGFYQEVDRFDIDSCKYNTTFTYKAQSNNTVLSGAVTISTWNNMSNSTANIWNASSATSTGIRCYIGDYPLYPYVTYDKMNERTTYDSEGSYYENPWIFVRLNSGVNPINQSVTCFKKNIVFNLQDSDNITVDGFTIQHGLSGIGINNDQTENAHGIIIKNNHIKFTLTSSGMITAKNISNSMFLNNTLFTGMGDVFYWQAVKGRAYDGNDTEMTGIQFQRGATNILLENNTIIGAFNGIGTYLITNAQRAKHIMIRNNSCYNVMDDCWELELYQENTSIENNYAYSVFVGVSLATGYCPTNDCNVRNNFVLANKTVPYDTDTNYTPYAMKFGDFGGLVTTGWNISHNDFITKNIAWFDTSESHTVYNTSVMDNKFVTGWQYDNDQATYTLYDTGYANNGVFFDYNLHWKYNGSSNTYLKLWNNNTGTLTNITSAKASAYWDGTWDLNSILADPRLATDFIPLSDSPACNAASDGTDIGKLQCLSDGVVANVNTFLYGSNIVFRGGVIIYG